MPDIVITPNRGTSTNPKIDFTGVTTGTIKLEVLTDGSLSFNGANGSLFSIADSVTGSLMSVNDTSGLPILEVFSTDKVVMGKYAQNTLVVDGTNNRIGIGTASPTDKLTIAGANNAGISFIGQVNGTITSGGNLLGVASNNIYLRPASGYNVVVDTGNGLQVTSGDIRTPTYYISSDTSNRFASGALVLRGQSPTIWFRDTDNNSAMIHVNSNIFYVLRGANDTESWTQVNSVWPLQIDLTNNNATFGGTVTAPTFSGAFSGNASTASSAATWTTARTFTIGSTGKSVNGSADVSWTLGEIGAAAASHNHTSLTSVTSIGFTTEGSDSASIATTISGTSTFFDFNLTDDNNNDWWRWRFTPSGSTVYDAMTLKPSANGVSDLVVSGTVTGTRLISNVATGTAPLTVTSTTKVTNLNADLLDGLDVHTGTNNEANKIVRTDGNGYIQAGWINTISGDQGTSAIDRVYASYDQYIRYYTPANFRTVLNVPTRTGGDASGSWAINASTATTLQTARNIAGVSFNGSADITLTGQNISTARGTAANDLEVAKYLRWKNYGNNHVLIDASAGTEPGGGIIDKYTAQNTINSTGAGSNTWGEAISLMGWNGSNTYGVRVDRARSIDNQANSATITATSANTASQIVQRGGSGEVYLGDVFSANWFRTNGANGLYNSDYAMHFYSGEAGYYNVAGGGSLTYGGLKFRAGHASTLKGLVYWDNDGFGLLNNNGNWAVRSSYGNAYSGGTLYGAWTKASSNYTSGITLPGMFIQSGATTGTPTAIANGDLWWNTDTGKLNIWWSTANAWVVATPTPDMSQYYPVGGGNINGNVSVSGLLTATGNITATSGGSYPMTIGVHPSYQSYAGLWRQGSDYTLITDGSTNTFLNTPNAGGAIYFRTGNNTRAYVESNGYFYANRYYDLGDTTYYTDPGSTSNLNGLTVNGSGSYYSNQYFYSNKGSGVYLGATNSPGLQAYSSDGGAAFLSFHRSGSYAVNMGLDPDNVFRIGGWSASAGRLTLNMSGDLWSANSMRSSVFYDQNDTTYFVDPAADSVTSGMSAKLKYSLEVNGAGSSAGFGLALYPSWVNTGGTTTQPTYGMMFASTATYGTHGSVSNGTDWATYFTMNNTANRGWIFRDVSTPANVASISNAGYARFQSLGINTNASGTAGEIRATDNITAYYSDERLKTKLGPIENPIEKVKALSGFYFEANETAVALGYQKKREIGVSAQEVQAILPEIVTTAPISDEYLTVRYEKMIPLLIEAIKAQQVQIDELKALLASKA
jgi:hypothetical protein